ncbi:hypothetical protein B0H14DRAFT_2765795 [Mycena olivaceomarginata]|nr:hypothetical protein B0H14DRAFT_2765795 [Mycena olivaceomarginata]
MSTIPSPIYDLRTAFAAFEISPASAETTEVENISAIYRIPNEILCEIFTLTYMRRVGDHINEEVPWRLGHICRVWRAAALGYPSLWSSITLDISLDSEGQIGHDCPPLMVETQLLRSGTAPLHVAFYTRFSTIVELCHSRSFDLILDQSFRWETVLLRLDQIRDSLLGNRLRAVKGKVPMLRHLQLTDCHKDIIGDTFSIAPSLREIVLTPDDGPQTSSLDPTTPLPWPQITKFRGSYLQSEDCVIVFNVGWNLVECGILSPSPHSSNGSHVVLPRLVRLAIFGNILNAVTAPLAAGTVDIRQHIRYYTSSLARLHPTLLVSAGKASHLRMFQPCGFYSCSPGHPDPQDTLRRFCPDHCQWVRQWHRRSLPAPDSYCCGGPPAFAIDLFLDMVQSRPTLSFIRAFYSEEATDSAVVEGLDVALAEWLSPLSRQNYMGMGRP